VRTIKGKTNEIVVGLDIAVVRPPLDLVAARDLTAGKGNITIQAGGATNTITAGAIGRVQLGDVGPINGNDISGAGKGNQDSVLLTGDGNDQVLVSYGSTSDSLTIVGNGNEKVKSQKPKVKSKNWVRAF
jgi:hypothetical protein